MRHFQVIFSIFVAVGVIGVFGATTSNGLQVVSDDELVERMKANEFVIALFSKGCPECEKYENELLKIHEDLKNDFPAEVVKVVNSHLVRLYKPTKEPALVFFRNGIPLLYEGSTVAEEIYHLFDRNRVPIVKELSDDTFEHLTQASTGATSGDWFIQFYTRNCIDCQRLAAVWEGVGALLRNRVNVARVDKEVRGAKTAKRFNVQKAPEFIFIRQGKYYRYEFDKYDVKSFVSFAQDFYRNVRAEQIKTPASPFDDVVSSIVGYLKNFQASGVTNIFSSTEHGHLMPIVVIAGFLLLIVALKCCRSSKADSAEKAKEKSKKSNDCLVAQQSHRASSFDQARLDGFTEF